MKYLVFFMVFASITPLAISDAIAIAPVERVPITSFGAYSSDGKEIQEIVAGKQVSLVSNVTNTLDAKQSFVYGTWIAENNGTRTPIDGIETSLDEKSSSVFSISWVPDAAGKYTIEASIWENNETFTAFSAIWQVTLNVIAIDSPEKLVPEPTPVCEKGTILKGDSCVVPNAVCGEGTTYLDGICVVNEPVWNTNSSGKWANTHQEIILPPLKQFKSGISIDEIQCRDGFVKVIKKSNNSPACVKPETKSKLVQRDWIEFQFSFCGPDGFDSKGNLNKNNSTHHWNENECIWIPIYQPEDISFDDFDETFGGPGNRHPAFLGYYIPDVCTNDMVKFLKKHSDMFDNSVPYSSPLDGEVLSPDVNPDDMVQCENELLENRDEEPSWNGK